MTFEEAVGFLDSFVNYEKELSWSYPEALGLQRMRLLMKSLGNPQNQYPSVIIAGSKAKGSTAAILSSILRMENLRVGLYTSPHLLHIGERIQVNGNPISARRFAEAAGLLKNILEDKSWRKNPPTYFELLTAMAFYHFNQMKIQVAVLEVGLGGLYDSTNVAEAKVAGLTPVSYEHTDKLGKTLSKIAVQKCGVIKGRELVVSAMQTQEARAVIQKTAEEREAKLFWVGKELRVQERDFDENGQRFDLLTPFGNYFNLEMSLLGRHQLENAALAVGLAKCLELKTRLTVSESAVRQGIRDARWPARLEKILESPKVVLDGAHNHDSAKRLAEALGRHFHFEKMVLVLGIFSDKDLKGMLSELAPLASFLVATEPKNPRALPAVQVAEAGREFFKEVFIEQSVTGALEKAKALAGPHDLILVTGSLFLAAEVKKLAEKT